MRVWLITISEPLPIDVGAPRLLRTGILADHLRARGHEVLWWNSTFDHTAKKQRFLTDTFREVSPGYRLALLHGPAYRHNVSLARLLNHMWLGYKFRRYCSSEARPDVILCSFPTIELSCEAVRYGKRHGVPVILDIRDLWPDTFVQKVPRCVRGLGKLAFGPLVRRTRFALRNADNLVAMSQGCLHWGLRYAQRQATTRDQVFPLAYRKSSVLPESIRQAGVHLKAKGVDENKVICWFIGTFGDTYDVGTIIEAARELERRGRQDLQFVLSGDGPLREAWTSQAQGLRNVVFTGWVAGPAIAYLMSVADIGLAAIHGVPETLPNKLFEYFAAALPVLSSLVGEEARALLDENECGRSYEPGNVMAFLNALHFLLQDECLRRRMSANALMLFQTRFDAHLVYPQMVDYLAQAANRDTVPQSRGRRVLSS
jgi:glycosyltransferase involved in cell wall biosynthesis